MHVLPPLKAFLAEKDPRKHLNARQWETGCVLKLCIVESLIE